MPVEIVDRYSVLGPPNGCKGFCEGTGFIPIRDFEEAKKMGPEYVVAWNESTDDESVWKFVRCPLCNSRQGK